MTKKRTPVQPIIDAYAAQQKNKLYRSIAHKVLIAIFVFFTQLGLMFGYKSDRLHIIIYIIFATIILLLGIGFAWNDDFPKEEKDKEKDAD